MSQKVENISHGVLLIGLGILAITHQWWPGLVIVLGVFFSFRNLLSKHYVRMMTNIVFFGGFYACIRYPFFFSWEFLLPILLISLGAERILGEFFSIRKKKVRSETSQSLGSSSSSSSSS